MGQSVLAIDDSNEIHRILEVRLRPEGLLLHHAFDAEEGIRKARELLPDLILLDLDMPLMTGFEVCQRLKQDSATSNVPVIFLTGASEVHSKVQGFDLGAVDYVTKPFETAELRARVRAALRTKRYQDMLAMRSQIDALTGLWNRAYLNQRLIEEVAAAHRYGRELSLVMLDVDHFKRLNDSYGHPFGDRVLQAIGESMAAACRATDIACRYGGEEFMVLLTDTPGDGAMTAATRLRTRIGEMGLSHQGRLVSVTASFGVASTSWMDRGGLSEASIVARADEALYAAKAAGRDRICRAA